jgi:hypothetical protein
LQRNQIGVMRRKPALRKYSEFIALQEWLLQQSSVQMAPERFSLPDVPAPE